MNRTAFSNGTSPELKLTKSRRRYEKGFQFLKCLHRLTKTKIMSATTHKGRKILESREPKIDESRKKSLFVKGRKSCMVLNKVYDDLATFRYKEVVKFTRTNDTVPFESVEEIEKFCSKQNCSLFVFFNHNKKRPNNMIFGRLFMKKVLEMYEIGIERYEGKDVLPRGDLEHAAVPALIFEGDQWEADYAPFRSVLMDFFVGDLKGRLDIAQVQHVIVFTIVESEGGGVKILFRHYQIDTESESEPKLSLIAPLMDWVPRRNQLPDEELLNLALTKPAVDKKKKNITKDELGRELGRVFVRKQDVSQLKLKKFDGLKKKKERREMPPEPADDAQ